MFFFLRCQCSPPSNITEKMVQTWNQSDFTPDTINWSELDVPVSISFFFLLLNKAAKVNVMRRSTIKGITH